MLTEAEIKALQDQNAKLASDNTALQASVESKDKELTTIKASLDESNKTVNDLRASVRKARLGAAITEEEWTAQKDILASLPDVAFDLVASRMTAPPKTTSTPPPATPAVLTVPTGAATGVKLELG